MVSFISDSYRYGCETFKVVTFYFDVVADNEWQAQHKAEFEIRTGSITGYSLKESEVRGMSAVEIDDDLYSS